MDDALQGVRHSGRMFPTHDILQAADALEPGDTPWQSELRLRQARWREHLGKPAGSVRPVGSRLPAGDRSSNFLTQVVADAVEEAKQQPGVLVTAPRIYENLLSSQPLAFNLFAELRADKGLASAVGRAMWPDLFATVEEVRFEWSPGRGVRRYLGNRSAFDVALLGRDAAGSVTCIGIEVKYHENMTQDPGSPDNPRYSEVAAGAGVFRNPNAPELRALPLRQLWFDHLLALSLIDDEATGIGRARFVLLASAINSAAAAVDAKYRGHLVDALTYERRTLEEIVAVIRLHTNASWIGDFRRRYLEPSDSMT